MTRGELWVAENIRHPSYRRGKDSSAEVRQGTVRSAVGMHSPSRLGVGRDVLRLSQQGEGGEPAEIAPLPTCQTILNVIGDLLADGCQL